MKTRRILFEIIPLPLFVAFSIVACSLSLNGDILNAEEGVALKGFDPVAYFDGKASRGNATYVAEYKSIRYYFTSEENQKLFQQSPESFLPEYGGYCAFAMLEAEKVDINPKRFKLIHGKVYLFYDGFWGNTLKKWNQLTKQKPEEELILQADQSWMELNSCND